MQPAPTKGFKTIPLNYRPIMVLLSVISTVMELIINSTMLKYNEANKLIHDRPYGFRHERSTADLLTHLSPICGSSSSEFHGEAFFIRDQYRWSCIDTFLLCADWNQCRCFPRASCTCFIPSEYYNDLAVSSI